MTTYEAMVKRNLDRIQSSDNYLVSTARISGFDESKAEVCSTRDRIND